MRHARNAAAFGELMMDDKEKTTQPKAVLYLRVSTADQAENFSLPNQEKDCKALCARQGWSVLDVFVDPGASARSSDREEFQRMLQFCKDKRVDFAVVSDLSRFARNSADQGHAICDLNKRGTKVRSVKEPNVDETAAGRLAANMLGAFNQYYSDALSERTSERMQASYNAGRTARPAPLGYFNNGSKLPGTPNAEPDLETAHLIAEAFRLLETGRYKAAEVLRIITEHGLRSKSGKPLTQHTFLKMMRNPYYAGFMQSKKLGTVVRGLHRPIVTEEAFNRVRLILDGRAPTMTPHNRNNPHFPLRVFLRCTECGSPLTGAPCGKKGYPYYWCRGCHRTRMLPKAKVEGQFVELLKSIQPGTEFTEEFAQILERTWKLRQSDTDSSIRKLAAEIADKKTLQNKLRTKWLNGDKYVTDELFQQMDGQFEQELAVLQARIMDTSHEQATFEQLLAFSRSMLVDISLAWERADIDQKQRVQNALFPRGLNYSPSEGILNCDNDSLFSQLEDFVHGKVSLARPERFELPT
jgi:site-specific DNA recombinase